MLNKKDLLILAASLIGITTTASMANELETSMPSHTSLHETNEYKATRQGKYFIISFKQDHHVLSTSDINGGQTSHLKNIINFQSVEGNGHDRRFEEILSLSNQAYHQQVADALKLESEKIAIMGTAANINNLSHVQKHFRDITVDAFVTAGVKGNALRAGDTTRWYQGENGNELIKNEEVGNALTANTTATTTPIVKDSGTINIILMLNRSLSSGALAKAATIITEAKSAALAELAIPSKQSSHLATGTGTDQYAIASPINSNLSTLDSASGHLKLGELIGDAVREAVVNGISLQNGLERSDTRQITHALSRFGATKTVLLKRFEQLLDQESFHLLKKNKNAVFKDAKLVAAAYAYAAILDRIEYSTLSKNIQNDVLYDQAVNAAIALSGKGQDWQIFREQLVLEQQKPLDLFIQACAIGWKAKWSK